MHDAQNGPEEGSQEPRRLFIEDFARAMEPVGLQRMAARVLAAILSADGASLTVRELASLLQVSSGALSGAVRQLETMRITHRRRVPGQRADHYSLGDPFWYEAITFRKEMFGTIESALDEGVEAVGSTSPAGLRIAETRDFFAYLAAELPALVERWHESRR